MSEPLPGLDQFDVRNARGADGLLRAFNRAGVLSAADVHVAARATALAGEDDDAVRLAAALAVRAPRLGHVHVDLASIRDTAAVDSEEPVDIGALPWPETASWIAGVTASALVAVGEDDVAGPARPFRLLGTWLYLDRYWAEERRLAEGLRAISERPAPGLRIDVLAAGLGRLFAGDTDGRQCLAAAAAVVRRLAVVAGGPGTGKTTTVARIVALLCEQAAAAGFPAPLVALAAPTGKAAARLEQAVHEEAAALADEPIGEELLRLRASTLHRLLGWRPGSYSRFRHDRLNRLPHEVVIVDETSMVSLSLMARLVEAVREDARLILVGDPGQLVSIEAGAVLGDIVGPVGDRLVAGPSTRAQLERATGVRSAADHPPPGVTVGDGIVVLRRGHRFGGGIAMLSRAIRRGDADATLELLAQAPDDVTWIEVDVADPATEDALKPVRDGALGAAREVIEAARAGAALEAIEALGAFRILCAHRRGPEGVATWTARIEAWLEDEVGGLADENRWYVGRPLLVTENDYELRLYNGDSGVIVQRAADRVSAAFERRGEVIEYTPTRLGAVDSAYAMTIHKSQGSQFDAAAVLLPGPASRVLTRELLYTAATRARRRLIVAGTAETIRAAVARPVARASGLGRRLWGTDGRC